MLSNMILSQCHVSNPGPGYKSKVESSSQIWPRQNLWTVFEVGLPVRNRLAAQWPSTVISKKEGICSPRRHVAVPYIYCGWSTKLLGRSVAVPYIYRGWSTKLLGRSVAVPYINRGWSTKLQVRILLNASTALITTIKMSEVHIRI